MADAVGQGFVKVEPVAVLTALHKEAPPLYETAVKN